MQLTCSDKDWSLVKIPPIWYVRSSYCVFIFIREKKSPSPAALVLQEQYFVIVNVVKATLLSIIINICHDFVLVKISSCTVKRLYSLFHIFIRYPVSAGFSQNVVISCSIQIIWGGGGIRGLPICNYLQIKGWSVYLPLHHSPPPPKINDTKGYIITPNDMPLVNIANDDAHICSIVNSVKSARITRR